MPVALDRLRVDCNIWRLNVQDLKLISRVGEHTTVEIDAIPETKDAWLMSNDLSGQPISVRVEDSDTLFYGIIYQATEYWRAGLRSLHITARSLSWLLDLEKKSRSFQETMSLHSEVFDSILDENDASAVYSFEDKAIGKPYIQYYETDWAFIRRIASRLGAQVISSARTEYPGLYIGFPDREKAEPLDSVSYRFGIDETLIRDRNGDKGRFTYYEFEDFTPRQMGDMVFFQGKTWHVSEVSARLIKGVLRFVYRLTGAAYNRALPEYNPLLRGLSLTGTVLKREAETLRLHLEIDKVQKVGAAYDYTWLPESGNIMYNMPPLGTRVSLYMQNADEHSAICIRNVRDNGAACAMTQKPNERYLTTEPQKSLSMNPETMFLSAMESTDSALIDDNFGCRFTSVNEVLIQASGNISISGAHVDMKAPQEMTVVRRNLGQPTVMNLCHNVDTEGGTGEVTTTGKPFVSRKTGEGQMTSSEYEMGEARKKAEQEILKKLKFKSAELLRQFSPESQFSIIDVFQTVVAAVPQKMSGDELARFSVGSRVLFGNNVDHIPANLLKRTPQRTARDESVALSDVGNMRRRESDT